MHRRSCYVVMLIVLLFSACSRAATPAPTIPPTTMPTTAPATTPTPAPTATPTTAPTATPTVLPTATGVPSPTPAVEGNVDVGGYTLFYRCSGEGSPTVILEDEFAHATASLGAWDPVVQGVAPSTRVCVYDRATLGKSQADVGLRTAEDIARDLHNLLQNANIGGPYVLVGHQFSGWFVRVFAAMYPEEVAGMVLAEALPPDWLARELELLPPQSADEPKTLTEFRDLATRYHTSTAGDLGEHLNLAASAEQAAALTSLGDIPLIVLSHSPTSGALFANLPDDLDARIEKLWQEMQVEQAKLSANGTLIVASSAGFSIYKEDPQLVVDAILKVVEQARKRAQ